MNGKIEKLNGLKQQRGAALLVAMIMLVALTVIGLSASQRSSLQERMAANVHLNNLSFNAAESAIGGFIRESNQGDKNFDINHILYKVRTLAAQQHSYCFDGNGDSATCDGTVWLDRNNSLEAKIEACVVDDCNVVMCGGFSLGQGTSGRIGCRIFKLDGTGTVGGVSGAAGTNSSTNSSDSNISSNTLILVLL